MECEMKKMFVFYVVSVKTTKLRILLLSHSTYQIIIFVIFVLSCLSGQHPPAPSLCVLCPSLLALH